MTAILSTRDRGLDSSSNKPSRKQECPSCGHMNLSSKVYCELCAEQLYKNCYEEKNEL